MAGQRGGDPAGRRVPSAAHRADRPRLPPALGQLATPTSSELHPDGPRDFETFLDGAHRGLRAVHVRVRRRGGQVPVEQIAQLAEIVAEAGTALSAHIWRSAAAGNLGGWQVARCLFFLNVLTGSVGTPGGTCPNGWNKFIAHGFDVPEGHDGWNELLWPTEYPLSTNEMSILLPHFLQDGRGSLEVYFTRVYNPMWTNPDGFTWIDALTRTDKIGLHVALTPTWSETATFADYVLPMGHATERHDTHSYETHAGAWLGFRQPVRRVAMEQARHGRTDTRDTNPGEVWEENEFWFELSWRIDPDGSLGIRRYFESPYRPGERVTVDEYYRWVFENRVPGLPEKAEAQGLTPLDYMRKYGVVEIAKDLYRLDERPLTDAELDGAESGRATACSASRPTTSRRRRSSARRGPSASSWRTGHRSRDGCRPSRKLELYSDRSPRSGGRSTRPRLHRVARLAGAASTGRGTRWC